MIYQSKLYKKQTYKQINNLTTNSVRRTHVFLTEILQINAKYCSKNSIQQKLS